VSDDIAHIYDRLVAAEKLKSGTKYERLGALVFQVLDRSALIVHDVSMRGPGKDAQHQIDVTATDRGGQQRRVIVEMRDRKDRVGLGQVRDFFGVIHQLEPDSAWIVSSTGFTADAIAYARDEGVGLAVLRPTQDGEDNRIKAIHFRIAARVLGVPTITSWLPSDEAEGRRLAELWQDQQGIVVRADPDDEFFYDANGAKLGSLRAILEPIFHTLEVDLGENSGTHEFERIHYLDLGGARAAVRGFTYSVSLHESINEFTVGNASSVAELIFRSVDGTVESPVDRVVYDTDLRGLALDEAGRVISRPGFVSPS
jgi:hypothetical protein